MAVCLIEKLLSEAVQTGGTYAEFQVSDHKIAFTCDGGSRRSTRNYRRTTSEAKTDERALKAIDDKSLLFTDQLKRIQATLSNGRIITFQRTDSGHFCTITGRRVTESKDKRYDYVRFISDTTTTTGIAFAIKQLNNGKPRIIPCDGSIMNGPFVTGLSTDLHFVLSGNFHVRNGVLEGRFEAENRHVIEELSLVMEKAIKKMLYIGLLGMPLFAVLPSSKDEQNPLSAALIRGIKNVCNLYPVFRNQKGNYVGRKNIVYGASELINLFPQEIAGPVLGDRYWGEIFETGSREEYFLADLGVTCYDRTRFINEFFRKENYVDCNQIFENQNDKWLRTFYVFCAEAVEDENTKKPIIEGFRNTQSMRDLKGNMHYPAEVKLAASSSAIGRKAVVIKPSLISPAGNDDEYSDKLRHFFFKAIGIKEYSLKPEMVSLAEEMMTKKQAIDRVYARKLLTLARFDESHSSEIDFGSYAIFPYESARGIRRACAGELVIGKPYVREGNLLATATGRKAIWKGLKDLLDPEELDSVLGFAERTGTIGSPAITRQCASRHRDFDHNLYAAGKQGARDSNYDYTIPGLQDILKRRSLQLSKLVWNAIITSENPEEFLYAEYSVNNRMIVNQCDSSLIQILRERTWIPGKDGRFYMPENITVSDISDQLPYDRDNAVLKALNFGEGIKRREALLKDLEKLAAKEGMHLVAEEEYQEFLKWRKQKKTRT